MQEDFLHYIWKFKKFDFGNAKTVEGFPVTIVQGGVANFNSGPDFFNATLKIGEQTWAGNVEIHIKSSDWYAHGHEQDPNYDNVILHVVWQDDIQIFRKDNSHIHTLELKDLVAGDTIQSYRNLLLAPNSRWINCEKEFPSFDDFELNNWLERLFLEKLQEKSKVIAELLKASGNNWEAVLFQLMSKNFGLKVNGSAFLSMAQSFDFKIIQKTKGSLEIMEALLLGQSGLLDNKTEDVYFEELKKEYTFLKRKYSLKNSFVERPKFFRLRPDNFPNIRLSQLAFLYSGSPQLFTQVIKVKSRKDLLNILQVETSDYWRSHYNFGKPHSPKNKRVTDSFIDLLIINTVVPIKFYYSQITGTGETEAIIDLINEIKAEKNTIIDKFNSLRPGFGLTALQSQGLLHMKNEYCVKNGCLKCNMGSKILRVLSEIYIFGNAKICLFYPAFF